MKNDVLVSLVNTKTSTVAGHASQSFEDHAASQPASQPHTSQRAFSIDRGKPSCTVASCKGPRSPSRAKTPTTNRRLRQQRFAIVDNFFALLHHFWETIIYSVQSAHCRVFDGARYESYLTYENQDISKHIRTFVHTYSKVVILPLLK